MNYFSDSNLDFDFFLKMALPPLNIPFRNLNAAPLLEGKEKNDYVQLVSYTQLFYHERDIGFRSTLSTSNHTNAVTA